MKKLASERRVLWAVDPIAEDGKLQHKMFKALTQIVPKQNVVIEPVTVTSPSVQVPNASFAAFMVEQKNAAEKLLNKWIKSLKDKRVISPTFLPCDGLTTGAMVRELLDYARTVKADFIAVGTHGRKGVQRFFIGSFAETLLLHSEIPVVLVNPSVTSAKPIKHILFATDFSAASSDAFDRVIGLAATLKAKVTLYSKIEYFVPQTAELMKVSHYQDFLENDKQSRKKKGDRWCARAEAQGVDATLFLDEQTTFIPEGILYTAKKKKADLVAMASSSGFWATNLVGSVVRKLVRLSPLPVWVIHPARSQKTSKQEPLAAHRPRSLTLY